MSIPLKDLFVLIINKVSFFNVPFYSLFKNYHEYFSSDWIKALSTLFKNALYYIHYIIYYTNEYLHIL